MQIFRNKSPFVIKKNTTKGITTALLCNIYLSEKRQHTGSTRAMDYLFLDSFFRPCIMQSIDHIRRLSDLTVIKIPSYSVTFSALQACKYLIISTCHVTSAKNSLLGNLDVTVVWFNFAVQVVQRIRRQIRHNTINQIKNITDYEHF